MTQLEQQNILELSRLRLYHSIHNAVMTQWNDTIRTEQQNILELSRLRLYHSVHNDVMIQWNDIKKF